MTQPTAPWAACAPIAPCSAEALERLAPVQPKVVAIDMVLADQEDPAEDERLRRAMQATKNLVLVAHSRTAALGGSAAMDFDAPPPRSDTTAPTNCRATASPGRSRSKSAPNGSVIGRWRLETFRLAHGAPDTRIAGRPANRKRSDSRPANIATATARYACSYSREPIPQVSLMELVEEARTGRRAFAGKPCSSA